MSKLSRFLITLIIALIILLPAAFYIADNPELLSLLPIGLKRGSAETASPNFISTENLTPADSQQYLVSRLDDESYANIVALTEGIANFEEKIELPYPMSSERIAALFNFMQYDYPELIQLKSLYSTWSGPDGIVSALSPGYLMTKDEYKSASAELAALIEGWKSEVAGKSELEKEKFVYDKMYEICRYDLNTQNSGTAYGCLIEGKARCEGYAKATVYALRALGVDCFGIVGRADDLGAVADDSLHAWVAVKIGGEYYLADPTWDSRDVNSDAIAECEYFYFNLDETNFNRNHTPLEEFVKLGLPQFKSMKYNYHVMLGNYLSSGEDGREFVKTKLSEVYERGGNVVNLRFESEAVYNDIYENLSDIIEDWLNSNYIFGKVSYKASRSGGANCIYIELNFR